MSHHVHRSVRRAAIALCAVAAWWLVGPELAQVSAMNAHLVRVIDSLTAHLDAERAARARLEAVARAAAPVAVGLAPAPTAERPQ